MGGACWAGGAAAVTVARAMALGSRLGAKGLRKRDMVDMAGVVVTYGFGDCSGRTRAGLKAEMPDAPSIMGHESAPPPYGGDDDACRLWGL